MLKLISWNVNGLRACYDKGFTDIFRQLDADFFCLQETKMQAGQLDLQFDGYQSYWNYAEKKGYSGTAVFTRLQPISVSYGMDRTEHDREGRIITLEMEDFFLVNVYTPNSQEGLKRLEYRMTWEDDFLHFLKQLETQKPVIVCGDLNVAHQEIDLKNPKTNRKNAGFTDEERNKFTQLLSTAFARTSLTYLIGIDSVVMWITAMFTTILPISCRIALARIMLLAITIITPAIIHMICIITPASTRSRIGLNQLILIWG